MERATLLLFLVGACFNPNFQQGVPCTVDGECPEGQVCAADDRCYDPDQIPDFNQNADLVGLAVSRGELDPPFDSATTEYQLALPLDAEDLVATPTAAVPTG